MTAFLAILLNLILAEEIEDEAASITANEVDAADDRDEWKQIQHNKSNANGDGELGEKAMEAK